MIRHDRALPGAPGPRPLPAAGATARTRRPELAGSGRTGRSSHANLTVLEPS